MKNLIDDALNQDPLAQVEFLCSEVVRLGRDIRVAAGETDLDQIGRLDAECRKLVGRLAALSIDDVRTKALPVLSRTRDEVHAAVELLETASRDLHRARVRDRQVRAAYTVPRLR